MQVGLPVGYDNPIHDHQRGEEERIFTVVEDHGECFGWGANETEDEEAGIHEETLEALRG